MDSNTKDKNCCLCLKPIEGESFYVDKYPHHKDCQTKVLEYLKECPECCPYCGAFPCQEQDNCPDYGNREYPDNRSKSSWEVKPNAFTVVLEKFKQGLGGGLIVINQ